MAGGSGGAWKVAYADFVTAMMAFFMVMWLTTQKEGVKEAVAGYFRDPFATFKSNEKGAAATAAPVENPLYGHTAQPQKRRLPISGDSTDYQFTVLFPVDDATLGASEIESIKDFAPMMVGKLNRVEVRGHCLRRPLPEGSPFSDHWQLCYARCQAVKKELEARGIAPERIRLSQAEGNEPLALNLSEEELQLNSRVDVILLPDLADIPWELPQKGKEPAEKDSEKSPEAPSGDEHGEAHGEEPGEAAPPAGEAATHHGESAVQSEQEPSHESAHERAHEPKHEASHESEPHAAAPETEFVVPVPH
jgi:chemotaxis protein MotB